MTAVDLVYFNAGGGHRATALALDEAIREERRPWDVRLVNLVDVLDPTAAFRRFTGVPPEAFYNARLARGWTIGLGQELKVLQACIRLGHRALVRSLATHWQRTRPDLIVSLVPNFNRALYGAATVACNGVPFVTVLTDMADHPPHFWIERGQNQHLVCGTARAVEQARAAGHPGERVWRTSGMILRPSFHRVPPLDVEAERRMLGLDPQRTTAVVLFGGHGSMQMLEIARLLPDLQLVLMCGHNALLAERLRAEAAGAPRAVIGFTPDVWRYLRIADFFIGKPGPGSISEAVQMGLPVLTFRNAWTMPQERYNTDWVLEERVGVVVRSLRELPAAVDAIVAGLTELRGRVASVRNNAVYEVPAIFERLVGASAEKVDGARADEWSWRGSVGSNR